MALIKTISKIRNSEEPVRLNLDCLEVNVSEGVLFQDIGGEVVLLHIESGDYYALNEVGSVIWKLLQEDKSVTEAKRMMLTEFDVSENVLARDFEEFLLNLQAKGFIELNEFSSK